MSSQETRKRCRCDDLCDGVDQLTFKKARHEDNATTNKRPLDNTPLGTNKRQKTGNKPALLLLQDKLATLEHDNRVLKRGFRVLHSRYVVLCAVMLKAYKSSTSKCAA